MYERILVPLDGSELAEAAIPYAEEIANHFDSEITLLFVREPKAVASPMSHILQRSPERGEGANPLSHILDSPHSMAESEAGGLAMEEYLGQVITKAGRMNPVVLMGHPAEEIVDYADTYDIGMIIMATHGRSGIRRWALGSVADKVVRSTAKPVLIIRAKGDHRKAAHPGRLNRILVPLDGSAASEASIPYVEELAYKTEAEVILWEVLATRYETIIASGWDYAIYPEQQLESDRAFAKDYLDKMVARLTQKGIDARSEVKSGTDIAAEEIIRFADEVSADVVAMSTHGRSGIARWTLGSVADKVLRRGNTPLLLVRPPKKR